MLSNYPGIRLGLYLASIVAAVAAPFVTAAFPEYGPAVATASGILAAAAGATAATNRTPKEQGRHEA